MIAAHDRTSATSDTSANTRAAPTILVQLTDLHIREPGRLAYRRVDTTRYFRAAVNSVLALKQCPHAVVITGDLTDFGRPD